MNWLKHAKPPVGLTLTYYIYSKTLTNYSCLKHLPALAMLLLLLAFTVLHLKHEKRLFVFCFFFFSPTLNFLTRAKEIKDD